MDFANCDLAGLNYKIFCADGTLSFFDSVLKANSKKFKKQSVADYELSLQMIPKYPENVHLNDCRKYSMKVVNIVLNLLYLGSCDEFADYFADNVNNENINDVLCILSKWKMSTKILVIDRCLVEYMSNFNSILLVNLILDDKFNLIMLAKKIKRKLTKNPNLIIPLFAKDERIGELTPYGFQIVIPDVDLVDETLKLLDAWFDAQKVDNYDILDIFIFDKYCFKKLTYRQTVSLVNIINKGFKIHTDEVKQKINQLLERLYYSMGDEIGATKLD